MDDWSEGTGVATYAHTLRAALAESGIGFQLLYGPKAPGARFVRLERFARCWIRSAVRATRSSDGFTAPDLFGTAQARFSALGRVTEVTVDGEPGICHWTYPVPLRICGWRNVYTLHDAIPLTHPRLTAIDPVRYHRLIDAIVPRAAAIVTVSGAARDDILSVLDIDAKRVAVLGQAVGHDYPGKSAPLPLGLTPGGFFLALGTLERRKNLPRLIAGHGASGTRKPLVIVGPKGWDAGDILRAIRAAERAIHLPFTNRDTVMTLLGNARALLFPSLAEGFGLPIAEAMACGTPVLTSRGGATEETAGGAALLVDPLKTADIASAITLLDRNDALCSALAEAGRRRAEVFSLSAYAERLRTFYGSLATQGTAHSD